MNNKIAKFREEKGLSQEELANVVGITRSYLSGIELAKRNPTGLIILRIARALDKKVEEIFFEV
jgi:putative transcriptional regulator